MSNLFLPGPNGKFQQKGLAHFELQAKMDQPVIGQPLPFEFSVTGDPNTIMAMMYDAMSGYPEVTKMLLTVFYKFCQDKGIQPADIKKHTYFAGS